MLSYKCSPFKKVMLHQSTAEGTRATATRNSCRDPAHTLPTSFSRKFLNNRPYIFNDLDLKTNIFQPSLKAASKMFRKYLLVQGEGMV